MSEKQTVTLTLGSVEYTRQPVELVREQLAAQGYGLVGPGFSDATPEAWDRLIAERDAYKRAAQINADGKEQFRALVAPLLALPDSAVLFDHTNVWLPVVEALRIDRGMKIAKIVKGVEQKVANKLKAIRFVEAFTAELVPLLPSADELRGDKRLSRDAKLCLADLLELLPQTKPKEEPYG